ncbi:hypothetical protein [Pontibacillus halophilus]|uniref:hypothetical protein n=1 Tax=Pontibacillus halophilus TaxID=516704 RepID=UPI0003FD2765|nr:hypothetical protein [Pontibacillus halophilus]
MVQENKGKNMVVINLWFSPWEKENYINLYKKMLDTYNETNKLMYSNIRERFNKYREDVLNEYLSLYNPEDIDYDDVGSLAFDRLEHDYLMEYQYHFSSIVNLYHVFEQHIRKLLYKEINHKFNPVETKESMPKFATRFDRIEKLLNLLDYPLSTTPSWSKINELNKLTNTYKHGDGNSATSLYNINKSIFMNEATRNFYYKEVTNEGEELYVKSLDEEELQEFRREEKILLMKKELNTATGIILRKDKTEFKDYLEAIIEFWESFPEHFNAEIEV